MTALPSPSVTGPSSECTTTWIAEEALPPKLSRANSRAATDSEPSACQPAPERFFSTCGAKTPSPTISRAHTIATSLPWLVTHRPRRPRGPAEGGAVSSGGVPALWAGVVVVLMGVRSVSQVCGSEQCGEGAG